MSTAWLSARGKGDRPGALDWAALGVAVALAGSLLNVGLEAANSETGSAGGASAGVFFAFTIVASLAAALDVRMIIMRGALSRAQRLTRHLWRMCAALFISANGCSACLDRDSSCPRLQ